MESLTLKIDRSLDFVTENEINDMLSVAESKAEMVKSKTGKGNEFLGWLDLPNLSEGIVSQVEQSAKKLMNNEAIVVIGIGGSYLGAKAVIEALSDSFQFLKKNSAPRIIYAGQNIGEDYLNELVDYLNQVNYGVVVISKSGTTTEPALAFRLLKKHLEAKIGQEAAKNNIVAITDAERGALKTLATQESYESFVIPDDVGGRFSVLTPVGLLPIACAGFNIREILKGAAEMKTIVETKQGKENPALVYAAIRNIFYKKGKTTEVLANYHPKLTFMSEWWKQLYGESEGKENKGIFPASVNFTTDLHSMGQYVQEGLRNMFETAISVKTPNTELYVEMDEQNLDKLNFLAGKRIDEVNKMAELGTAIAHVDGGVPNLLIEIPKLNEYYLGQLIYFFEYACAVSGYILDVNPFDQPGVEAYKKNMFALLGKPGFEKETEEIKKRI